MAVSGKKIIVVVGATGVQGSSVARTFLKLSDWHVRCFTRNTTSEAAKALETQGAELTEGDLRDPASLTRAFYGAHSIFLNTEFWSVWKPARAAGTDGETASQQAFEYETKNGKNAVDAAAGVPTLERLVFSGLFPMSKASNGKYQQSKHPEAKAWIYEYILNSQPSLARKTSLIVLGAYSDNQALTPRFDPTSQKYAFVGPFTGETKMPIIDAGESTGPFVRELIENEEPGTKFLAYDSYLTFDQLAEAWSQASGKESVVVSVSIQTLHEKYGLGWEHLEPAAFVGEFGYTAGLDGIIEPSDLKHPVQTKPFEQILKERNWGEILKSNP